MKKTPKADDLWGCPMTPGGADLLARRHGYRLHGFLPPLTPDRFLAVFVPEPDDGSSAVVADGRTKARALRRGLEGCRLATRAEPADRARPRGQPTNPNTEAPNRSGEDDDDAGAAEHARPR